MHMHTNMLMFMYVGAPVYVYLHVHFACIGGTKDERLVAKQLGKQL